MAAQMVDVAYPDAYGAVNILLIDLRQQKINASENWRGVMIPLLNQNL